jgi:acyl-coenzyme A synthetase/AMP-(fatty) acid ligase
MLPRRLIRLSAMPHNASGKIDRHDLERRLSA